MLVAGVIADTHGLLRPQAEQAVAGSDLILHAGDVGDATILARLERIAPVHAVRGNVDVGPFGLSLPPWRRLEVGGSRLLLHHGHRPLPPEAAVDAQVIVQGHSHRGRVEWQDGILFMNPGSAGPRRFRLPVTVGLLHLDGGRVGARLVELA